MHLKQTTGEAHVSTLYPFSVRDDRSHHHFLSLHRALCHISSLYLFTLLLTQSCTWLKVFMHGQQARFWRLKDPWGIFWASFIVLWWNVWLHITFQFLQRINIAVQNARCWCLYPYDMLFPLITSGSKNPWKCFLSVIFISSIFSIVFLISDSFLCFFL